MKEFGTAAILCGGKSRRMGFDKSEIKIEGRLLVEIIAEALENIFQEVILISNEKEKFKDLKYRIVEDIVKEAGPMGGIHAALRASSSRYMFVTACDMPVVNRNYIEYLMDTIKEKKVQGAVSRNGDFIEPLYAFYSVDLINTFEKNLENKSFKIFEALVDCNILYVSDEKVREFSKDKSIFMNLNYLKDLDFLKKLGFLKELDFPK